MKIAAPAEFPPFVLHEGDAREVLGSDVVPGSVAMAYCDPPFGNQQVWRGKAGSFDDRWFWTAEAADGLRRLQDRLPELGELLGSFPCSDAGRGYLVFMAEMLIEVRATLSPVGTLWLHHDDTMGAYLRVTADVVFRAAAFGAVIWKRTSAHGNARVWGRVHDTIACYGRTPAARLRLARCRGEFSAGDPLSADDPFRVAGFAEDRLNQNAAERVDYPTQKPVALLDRLIRAATLPGDLVLDPTCGSGSALVAAVRAGRRAIGVDRSGDAIRTSALRLAETQPRQFDLFGASSSRPGHQARSLSNADHRTAQQPALRP